MTHFSSSDIFKGQTALVTGGTSGIGKAIAIALASHGAHVAIIGTNPERGTKVVEEIKELTQENLATFYPVDISQTAAVDLAIKSILENRGAVDILVNNAGITCDQLLMKMSEEDWDKVIDVNLKSCYNTCHGLVRPMMKARKGIIINISSIVGLIGNAGQSNYAAAKAGMIGFTKSLALELAPRNIRANCICPGFITTAMTDELTEEQKKTILEKIPLGRLGTTQDIAEMVIFLASPAANYITGQTFVVDGGMVM